MARLARGRGVRWFAGLTAIGLVVAACGRSTPATTTSPPASTTTATAAGEAPTTTTAATAPTTTQVMEVADKMHGGEVVIGADREPETLNWVLPGGSTSTTFPIVARIGQAYWTGVQEIDAATLEFIPEVVTELPTTDNGGVVVNADGTMTVTYEILDEAQWADGTPISGDDFQFTLDTIMNPDHNAKTAVYEEIIASDPGPKTFTYTLAAPTIQYERLFDRLIPKHDVEGSDFVEDWNDTTWVSGGPFLLSEWQKGEFIRLARNPNYWKKDPETGQQLPYLDNVVFRFIEETDTLITAFKSREVDVINPPPAAAVIEDLQRLEQDGASVEVLAEPVWEHLTFQFGDNRTQRNPDSINDNLKYRRAVAHLIDRQAIVDEILAGQVPPLDSFVQAFAPTRSLGAWSQYDFSLDQAAALIEEVKADLGIDEVKTVFSTTSNNDARTDLSELLVNMFGAAGITYENQLEDSQLFFGETLDFGAYDLGEFAWIGKPGLSGMVASMDAFDPEGPPPEGTNVYRWGTPEVSGQETEGFNQGPSSVIDEHTARFAEIHGVINSTVDAAQLITLLNEAEQLIADQVVIIPLYARPDPAAVWADEIGGYRHNASDAEDTWNIETWYRVDL